MQKEEKIKLFNDVFAPKAGEKVLFLVDIPHDNIKDNKKWADRRDMANDWFQTFKKMGEKKGFSVEILKYNATGLHNTLLSEEILNLARNSDLVIAMTEFSASSSLFNISNEKNAKVRCASMPTVEKRMEETAFKADYKQVQSYAASLEKILEKAEGANVNFSTGDHLYVDLRNRTAKREAGDCTKSGQCINFPSGESWKVPYEAAPDENEEFGESKTEGILPQSIDGELVRYTVKNNKIVEIIGTGKKAEEMRKFFSENKTRRNIAEFAIGCNTSAVVTGNLLEDEKCSGLHIGYAMSTQLGGKVKSDMHEDIVFTKGCPVEASKVTLINKDGTKTEIIQNAEVNYDLLK
jgi:leucyl aminopeptidase (aminopeptidase T)